MAERTRVMLVDDHASLRAGLELVLARDPGLEVVAQAADATDAVRQATARGARFLSLPLSCADGTSILENDFIAIGKIC